MTSHAQVEVKTNFANLFRNKADLSLSFELSNKFEMELTGGLAFGKKVLRNIFYSTDFIPKYKGYYFDLAGKYHPKIPKFEAYYFGTYFRLASFSYKNSTGEHPGDYYKKFSSLGIIQGYKFILREHIVVDLSTGLGVFIHYESELYNPSLIRRPTQNEIDLLFKAAIGYRF
jgi:hypothetical protein